MVPISVAAPNPPKRRETGAIPLALGENHATSNTTMTIVDMKGPIPSALRTWDLSPLRFSRIPADDDYSL